jgi:1,4-dihydroxy-2-naphthoate octaprenyltransferase
MADDPEPSQARSVRMPLGEILWMVMMGLILVWGWGYIDSFRRK